MKLLQKIKSIAILLMVFGFFFSATLVSCGNKKTDEESTEHMEEHSADGEEHPTEEDEHPE